MIFVYSFLGFGLLVGIVHLVFPLELWKWRKTMAEAKGHVFQESPSEQALAFIRLSGFFYVAVSIGAALLIAILG